MSHERLTKVLADGLAGWGVIDNGTWVNFGDGAADAATLVSYLPPAIADRLERALETCATCGLPRQWVFHEDPPTHDDTHPYQPLVVLP